MSRKRHYPYSWVEDESTTPNIEISHLQYFPRGCYCTPQIVPTIEPSVYIDDLHMEPCFSRYVTQVAHPISSVYYTCHYECPTLVLPQQLETNRFENCEMPHIDADDYYNPPERKYVPYGNYPADGEDRKEATSSNVYRSTEGYLVEEPADDAEQKKVPKTDHYKNE